MTVLQAAILLLLFLRINLSKTQTAVNSFLNPLNGC